jgi:hypothetical protein
MNRLLWLVLLVVLTALAVGYLIRRSRLKALPSPPPRRRQQPRHRDIP